MRKGKLLVGQGSGALHTMAVLQTYQPDLLRDLDKGQGSSSDASTAAHHRSGSPGHQMNRCHDRKVNGVDGGHGETSVDNPRSDSQGVLARSGSRIRGHKQVAEKTRL